MAKRKRYDDKFRASAIVMLEATGYPDNPHKIEEVARHCGIPSRTLRRWYNGENNPPPDNVVIEEKKELHEQLRELAHLISSKIPAHFEDASLQEMATALGIVIDKMRLLENNPTSINENRDGLSDSERASRITRILDTARARRDGRADSDGVHH